jgi:hypothetical protein
MSGASWSLPVANAVPVTCLPTFKQLSDDGFIVECEDTHLFHLCYTRTYQDAESCRIHIRAQCSGTFGKYGVNIAAIAVKKG